MELARLPHCEGHKKLSGHLAGSILTETIPEDVIQVQKVISDLDCGELQSLGLVNCAEQHVCDIDQQHVY